MLTFKERIEDRIGSVGDDNALDSWLTAGAKLIINLLPETRLEKFTTPLTDGGSGVEVKNYRVLSANKNGYGAIRVSQNLIARVSDANSIYAATTEYPAWYILDGLAYVKPSGGTILVLGYPDVYSGTDTIPNFPRDIDESVVIYACINGRFRQMTDLTITTLGGLSISAITAPTAPSSPVFSYMDAVYSDASYTDAQYTSALYVNALIDTITATSISFTDTLEYIEPAFTGSYTNADTALTNQDIELANAHLSKIGVQLEEMQKALSNSLGHFNKDKNEFDANLQIAINQASLTQQRLIEQTRIQIELNKFNAQQALQEALANAAQQNQTDIVNRKAQLELDITNKSKALEVQIINASKELERQIQEYAMNLQAYGQSINAYSIEINQEVSRVGQRINQYNAQFQQLAAGLQVLQQEFQNYIKAL